MSQAKSQSRRPAAPVPALEAALASAAADPLRHAIRLDALEQQLRPCLPPALAAHCRLANVTGDRLVFVVDSPVWNAKLRLASAHLVEVARSLGLGINSVIARTSLQPLFQAETAGQNSGTGSPVARAALREAMEMLEASPAPGAGGTAGPRPRSKR
ncbi:DUF721 domain-containing protein [Pseudoxanthomonas winnipegensis]|uniref:DUF721 domain-containing protein n=1 Tax=Pseudoxanthomonas winnipegensis TaxID=2480810 RepID=A0A4Q8LQN4_9GAMM|nr:DUF721 domain-containing protein [Pseudoxanthomonas winnipegensis]RZZ89353.1 DUF721 domain-containing protein [Pseudoxanthomonas winnipegensis]TAA33201.1 DUF721 domain-containing protein [Pseudoxanthomonas winnipegensis]TAA44222.1 DUF721 domain-containing protein [Pseudoxanthomonas winnipegensis]TBV72188.1 DUF721 domain-containing protein [Pseudoxanthomonas winnipegensis]